MKGNPPKPPAIKTLQGNAGKRKIDQGAEAPEIPAESFFSPGWGPAGWLPEGAKEVWRQVLPIALRETKLQESGLQVFAAYCDAVYRLQKYTGLIEANGDTYQTESGYVRKRPEVEMRDRAANDVRNLASELNLTPKSWIGSMGTYAGRQLDMFMNGGRGLAPAPDAPGAAPPQGKGLDEFLGGKPTLQ